MLEMELNLNILQLFFLSIVTYSYIETDETMDFGLEMFKSKMSVLVSKDFA